MQLFVIVVGFVGEEDVVTDQIVFYELRRHKRLTNNKLVFVDLVNKNERRKEQENCLARPARNILQYCIYTNLLFNIQNYS